MKKLIPFDCYLLIICKNELKFLEVPGAPTRLSTPSSTRSTPRRSSLANVAVTKTARIIRPLADVTVMEGRRAAMSCELEAQPSPDIQWFKDGRVSAKILKFFDIMIKTF